MTALLSHRQQEAFLFLKLAVEEPGALPSRSRALPWGRLIPNSRRQGLIFALRSVGLLQPAVKMSPGLFATEHGRLAADDGARFLEAWRGVPTKIKMGAR